MNAGFVRSINTAALYSSLPNSDVHSPLLLQNVSAGDQNWFQTTMAMCPWTNYLNYLSHNFPNRKIRTMITVPQVVQNRKKIYNCASCLWNHSNVLSYMVTRWAISNS